MTMKKNSTRSVLRAGVWILASGYLCVFSVLAATPTTVTLKKDMVLGVVPARALDEKAFADRWGQFELQLVRRAFPLKAPNCRRNVVLRMPGVTPDAAHHADKLKQRWDFYQQVLQLRQGQLEEVALPLDTRHYVKTLPGGEVVLKYCNAFVDVPL